MHAGFVGRSMIMRASVAVGLGVLAVACQGGADGALGPAESFLLLAPVAHTGALVRPMELGSEPALTLGRVLNDGFASEMVRTVHLAKQLVRRSGAPVAAIYTDEVRAAAAEPLCLVVGRDEPQPVSRGLAFERWARSPQERPQLRWVGLSANIEGDKALVQTVTGRLAAHAAAWIVGGAATGPAPPLVDGYRMAMEVIAREWRAGTGSATALPSTAGTMDQRRLFARVRENAAVLDKDGQKLRPAAELLADPGVAATVIHRLAQTRAVANRSGPVEMYAPFVAGKLPDGVNPALVLGPVRNFQAKLFSAWAQAIGQGQPPADIVDLLQAYLSLFPAERKDVIRIFLVTTFAGTVLPGGISRAPADATLAITQLAGLTEDVLNGRRGLRDALTKASRPETPSEAAGAPAGSGGTSKKSGHPRPGSGINAPRGARP
jgi:hypothetical protein